MWVWGTLVYLRFVPFFFSMNTQNIFNSMYSPSSESWLVSDTILSSGIQWKASLEFISWRGAVQKNEYLSHFSASSFFYLMVLGRIPSKATSKDISEEFLNEISKYTLKDSCKELNLQNYFKMKQPISPWIQTDIGPSH